MNHIDSNFFRRKIDQRVGQGFDQTVHIALDYEVELVEVSERTTTPQLFESETFLRAQPQLALQLFATTGNLTCLLDFSEKAGVGLRFVRELEQGKTTLRLDKVNKVFELFGSECGPVPIKREGDNA